MVGRSLHRQGILDCLAHCLTSEAGRRRQHGWYSLQPHGPHQASGHDSSETPTNLVAHLFAELLPAGGSFIFGNIEPIEDVEFLEDRVTIARHRQDAQQFAGRPARARDFPSAYRVGAITGRTSPCPPRTAFCRSHHRDPRGAVLVRRRSLGQIQAGVPAQSGRVPSAENSSLPAGRQDLSR